MVLEERTGSGGAVCEVGRDVSREPEATHGGTQEAARSRQRGWSGAVGSRDPSAGTGEGAGPCQESLAQCLCVHACPHHYTD